MTTRNCGGCGVDRGGGAGVCSWVTDRVRRQTWGATWRTRSASTACYAHLRKLQEIADANKDTRAEGTPWIRRQRGLCRADLRDKGFDVQMPEFERLGMTRGGNPTLTVAGRSYPVDQASLLLTPRPAG